MTHPPPTTFDHEGVYNCQALVPNPVPLNPIPFPNPKKKNPKFYGTGGDTIITWATHPTHPPPITFNHEGVL